MSNKWIMFIGTYTRREAHVDGKADGIFTFSVDINDGELRHLHTRAGIINPSFLTLDPSCSFLYAVSETDTLFANGSGAAVSFSIERESGKLRDINQMGSGGTFPCHISSDFQGKFIFVSNYGNGSVSMIPVQESGCLAEPTCIIQHKGSGPNKERQEGPHVHSATATPDGSRLLVADLGTDQLYLYKIDKKQRKLNIEKSYAVPPGSGPRHITFHPSGKFGCVINELNSTINPFDYNHESGEITIHKALSTLPGSYTDSSFCADIHFNQSGSQLYCSNRGHNSICRFEVGDGGQLCTGDYSETLGKTPRNFAMSPDGRFLFAANQDSSTVTTFKVSSENGSLSYVRSTSVPTPVCLLFLSPSHSGHNS